MKINTGYYGIPKQLYHTSYSPLENNRASSLQISPSFTHPIHPSNTITRPDNSPVFVVRELHRSNLSGSQATQPQLKIKQPSHDYYDYCHKKTSGQDVLAQIQQKMQEITKKINKNTDDIKSMQQKEKTNYSINQIQKIFAEQIEKIEQKQSSFNQECLLKIVKVKQQIFEISSKFTNLEAECNSKLAQKTNEKILIKVRNLIEQRVKQQTVKIRLIIQNETNKLVHELKWQPKDDPNSLSRLTSKLRYPFKAIKMNYNEFIEVAQTPPNSKGRMSTRQSSESPRSGRYIFSQQRVYYIDKDGYLLDQDNYYLLDEKENMIRLDQSMLNQLKKQGLLKQ